MTTFTLPLGSPDGLRGVATSVSALSSTVGETRADTLRTAGDTAVAALPLARVAAFAAARGDATQATSALGLSLVSVGGALVEYADALEIAQQAVSDAATRHDDAEMMWRAARNSGDTEVAEDYLAAMRRESTAAEDAKADLSTVRQRVTTTLTCEVDVWCPGGGTLTPVQAWQQAATGMLPPGVVIGAQDLYDIYTNPDVALAKETATKATKVATKGYALYGMLNYLRAPALSKAAEAKLLMTQSAYQAIKGAAPDLKNPKVYKEYLKAERAMLKAFTSDNPADVLKAQRHYAMLRGLTGDAKALSTVSGVHPTLTTAEIVGKAGKFDSVMRPIRAVGPIAAKVLGPLSIGMGAYDIYTAVTDSSMATDNRVARAIGGTASVVGGVLTTAVAFGLVANPVGLTVIAGAAVVAGGAWIYENREAIVDGAQRLGSWIAGTEAADVVKEKATAVADTAKKVWKGLFG